MTTTGDVIMVTPSTPRRTRRAVRRRFTRAQILGLLREAAAGTPLMDLCWNHCISRSTFRAWKAKYGATASDAQTGLLQQLELENARLRSALARANSDRKPLRLQSPGVPPLPARTRSIASYRTTAGECRTIDPDSPLRTIAKSARSSSCVPSLTNNAGGVSPGSSARSRR